MEMGKNYAEKPVGVVGMGRDYAEKSLWVVMGKNNAEKLVEVE